MNFRGFIGHVWCQNNQKDVINIYIYIQVNDLCWSRDSKLLYSGHMSGAVIAHQMVA